MPAALRNEVASLRRATTLRRARNSRSSVRRTPARSKSHGGLYDTWHAGRADALRTFTILTSEPNALMQTLHNRMPLIVPPEHAPSAGSIALWAT